MWIFTPGILTKFIQIPDNIVFSRFKKLHQEILHRVTHGEMGNHWQTTKQRRYTRARIKPIVSDENKHGRKWLDAFFKWIDKEGNTHCSTAEEAKLIVPSPCEFHYLIDTVFVRRIIVKSVEDSWSVWTYFILKRYTSTYFLWYRSKIEVEREDWIIIL